MGVGVLGHSESALQRRSHCGLIVKSSYTSGYENQYKETTIVLPVVTFGDATGSRPFGWIGHPPGGVTPFNHYVSKVGVSEGKLGPLGMVSSVYSLLKFRPQCWQPMSVLKFVQPSAKKLLKEMIKEVVSCPSFESYRLITWGRTWQPGSKTAYCRYYIIYRKLEPS